jgi:predicted NBD/HSP70 family sugar kinase
MTAQRMCSWVRKAASDWPSDVAAIGYPGPAVHGRPVHEPYNMSKGWVGFDFAKGLGCVEELQTALNADYVVLGGGNVEKIKTLLPKTRLGANGNAFIGGHRLWSAKQGAGSSAFAK